MSLIIAAVVLSIIGMLFIMGGFALMVGDRPIGAVIAWMGSIQMSAAAMCFIIWLIMFLIDYAKA